MTTVDLDSAMQQIAHGLSDRSTRVLRDIVYNPVDRALAQLRLTAAEDILDSAHCETLRTIEDIPLSDARLSKQTVLIMKLTRLCNLRCTYCNSWRSGPGQVMSFATLASATRNVITNNNVESVDFVWHGGEVTLLPPSSLETAIWLQERYRRPHVNIANSIQTNATRLSEEWLKMLRKYGVSVGVSIDGPENIHDARRVSKNGKGTWREVKQGISALKENNIDFGLLSVVDDSIIDLGAERYLDFLASCGASGVALLNVLPSNVTGSKNSKAYLDWSRYHSFLRSTFHIWYSEYRSTFIIREFESLIDAVTKGQSGLCLFSSNCMGQYLTVEPDGEISACDKYVGDSNFVFGKIDHGNSIMVDNEDHNLLAARQVVDDMKLSVSRCQYYRYCQGGCPHDTRINRSFLGRSESGCCGLGGLMSDIVEALKRPVQTGGIYGYENNHN